MYTVNVYFYSHKIWKCVFISNYRECLSFAESYMLNYCGHHNGHDIVDMNIDNIYKCNYYKDEGNVLRFGITHDNVLDKWNVIETRKCNGYLYNTISYETRITVIISQFPGEMDDYEERLGNLRDEYRISYDKVMCELNGKHLSTKGGTWAELSSGDN